MSGIAFRYSIDNGNLMPSILVGRYFNQHRALLLYSGKRGSQRWSEKERNRRVEWAADSNWLMDINCNMLNFAQQTRVMWWVQCLASHRLYASSVPFCSSWSSSSPLFVHWLSAVRLLCVQALSAQWWFIAFKIISIFFTINTLRFYRSFSLCQTLLSVLLVPIFSLFFRWCCCLCRHSANWLVFRFLG